ncbi:MAG TPA: Nramp family divalent metal transporter [Gemmataceae bacterium]|nr:Nramp family divalent metal transporter [Gemmataceae bacterium]
MKPASGQAFDRVPSLEDIHSSVPIPQRWWRRFLAFSGPAFMVSVGYMDPGNWGTDLEAGSKYGHRLIWVLLMSNLMAVLLQALASRLGIVAGRDLAQACRESYPRRTVFGLWLLTEIAIAATDLAEVIGTIIALKLLFNIPYLIGLTIAAADTLLLLALQRRGVRLLELLTLALIAVIAGSFVVEIVLARPAWAGVLLGFMPGLDPHDTADSLYVAIAMLGATVMPHNLYLHSALVQTRAFPKTPEGKRFACKYNLLDSALALNGAFFINAAILVVAATVFSTEVKTLQQAHKLLQPVWGGIASALFAVALLASGQSSTLTGTLSGQVVMEGFIQLRLRPWVRRLLTRLAAIVPALLMLSLASAQPTGETPVPPGVVDERLLQLLVLSQAILSFQLPFAIIPLVQLTSDRRRMGELANSTWMKASAWLCAAVVVGLNIVLIGMQMVEWAGDVQKAGWNSLWIYGTIGPLAVALAGFLLWVTLYPHYRHREVGPAPLPPPELPAVRYQRIGVAVEFTGGDSAVLTQAAATARLHHAPLLLIHVVEGPVADYYGPATDDQESRADRRRMAELVKHLQAEGLTADGTLGYGEPAAELVRIAREQKLDFLVLGTHGHRFFADLALGETVSPVLHRLQIPILVVPTALT